MISTRDIAWMAGVIDLKGRIIYKNNKTRRTAQTVLIVDCKDMVIIRELCRLTGTSVEAKAPKMLSEFMRRGCVEHCPDQHIHTGPDYVKMPSMGRWTQTGSALVVVLSNLEPFLRVDRGYPEIIQNVINDTRLVGQGATAIRNSLKRLDALGWDIPKEFEIALQPLALTAA